MTTQKNIDFEQTISPKRNFDNMLSDVHAWLMSNLLVGETLEGTFTPSGANAYRSNDPKSINRQSRYAVRRYRNYVVGFVEDWDALYEFLPDRVYRHSPVAHHLYPSPPTYDFQSQLSLRTDYAFYRPKGVRSVYHRRLKLTSADDLTGPFEFTWVRRSPDEDSAPHSKLYLDGTLGATNGQLIRDIEDILRSTTNRLFSGWTKIDTATKIKGGYWWCRMVQGIDNTSTQKRVIKFRNGFEAFDPSHPNLVEVCMKAKDMTQGGNVSECVFDEFLVDCVKILTAAVSGSETA